MGGKDGGGGPTGARAQYDSELGMWFENGYAIEEGTGNITSKTKADILAERAPKPAAPVIEKAPEPAPAPAPAAMVAPPPPLSTEPIGPPIAAGGGVAPPAGSGVGTGTTGGELGGAVLKPPKYWIGGLNQYSSAPKTGKGAGSLKTTN